MIQSLLTKIYPGPDRITVELNKNFKKLSRANHSLISQRNRNRRLIPQVLQWSKDHSNIKQGKATRNLQVNNNDEYRFKKFNKILAKRIQISIKKIIPHDHMALFILEKQGKFNICKTINVINLIRWFEGEKSIYWDDQ